MTMCNLTILVRMIKKAKTSNDDHNIRKWVIQHLKKRKCFNNVYCSSRSDEDKIIAAALMKLFSNYSGKSIPNWATLINKPLIQPYFLHSAIANNHKLIEWSIRTTPKILSDLNVFACDNYLNVF